jgi:hypothetical protein
MAVAAEPLRTTAASDDLMLYSFRHDRHSEHKTWVMGVAHGRDLLPEQPPGNGSNRAQQSVGFWNNMPLEEQREPSQLLPPAYTRRETLDGAVRVNLKEFLFCVLLVYLFMGVMFLFRVFGGH